MYFLALVCDPSLEEKVLQLKYQMRDRYGCVTALRSPAHITLVAPFWLDEPKEGELYKALDVFDSDIGSLQIELNGFSHFNRKVLFIQVIENPGLEELKNQVTDHFINQFGDVIKRDLRPFHPHITIANRDLKPGDFLKAWEQYSRKTFKEHFEANTISLLKLSPGKWDVVRSREL